MANPTLRVSKELADIQKGSDLSLAVAVRERNVRNIRALIIGPPETPYEFGFFEFKLHIPSDYPFKSPRVQAITTNGGRARFNPNIYAEGKVCLSILGTWRTENTGESWSTAQGIESVLISIQSLMSSNPYENEPGYESYKVTEPEAANYAAKIRHETLRISVIQRLESILAISDPTLDPDALSKTARQTSSKKVKYTLDDDDDGTPISDTSDIADRDESPDLHGSDDDDDEFDPFKDLFKHRFLWYYDPYLAAIERASNSVKDNQKFTIAPFEFGSNTMDGRFHYDKLKARIERIRNALDAETASWAEHGKLSQEKHNSISHRLQRTFEQTREWYKTHSATNIELSLVDKNPFVWALTLIGRNNTDLAGGAINIRVNFSVRFPDEQPRVKVTTKLFHHRINSIGVLCYRPEKPEDIKSHIEGVITAIEDENPAYDPRTLVNPDAAALRWDGEDGLKKYRRRLRRSVEDSWEN